MPASSTGPAAPPPDPEALERFRQAMDNDLQTPARRGRSPSTSCMPLAPTRASGPAHWRPRSSPSSRTPSVSRCTARWRTCPRRPWPKPAPGTRPGPPATGSPPTRLRAELQAEGLDCRGWAGRDHNSAVSDFERDTAVRRDGDAWTADLQPRWNVGNNPNGGYLLAIAVRAMQEEAGRPDPVTVTAHYPVAARRGPGHHPHPHGQAGPHLRHGHGGGGPDEPGAGARARRLR